MADAIAFLLFVDRFYSSPSPYLPNNIVLTNAHTPFYVSNDNFTGPECVYVTVRSSIEHLNFISNFHPTLP